MPSVISAGTTAGTAVNISGDTTGNLAFQTNGTTTALTLNTSQNATFVGSINSPNTFGFKNRIINGGMTIAQRGTSFAGVTGNQYVTDRFQVQFNSSGTVTSAQASSAPTGFNNSWQQTVTATKTPGTSDYAVLTQVIEGFNWQDLGWGTANAKTCTLSFWVNSSVTGTYSVFFRNAGAFTASYVATYSIPSANTWTYITITVPGDTSYVWSTGNSGSLQLGWDLGSGSNFNTTAGAWQSGSFFRTTGTTNWISNSGATFFLTGVQLEVGSAATSFDFRSYGQELALCQRYTYRHSAEGDIDNFAPLGLGRYYGTNTAQLYVPFKVTMRTSPSSVTQIGNIVVNDTGLSAFAITLAFNETSSSGATVIGTTTSGTTAGNATTFYANGTSSAALIFSAEL